MAEDVSSDGEDADEPVVTDDGESDGGDANWAEGALESAGAAGEGDSSESQTLEDPNLYIGYLAIREEFLNLSELLHCIEFRRKIFAKQSQILTLGETLVHQRYLTPENLDYLLMIEAAEPPEEEITLDFIQAEVDQQVAEIVPGSTFAHYLVEEEIGRGGMGIVLRAVDTENDDAECALKILIGGKEATVRDIERFKKEATVMQPLVHDGIVRIYEVARHQGLDYIAMEFVEGVSLKELLGLDKPKPLADDEALLVIRSAAEAVGFMHKEGIIHRDIKPENLMVRPDGTAVLMDFGLAGWDKIEILSGRGSIGTPMYQPPEQADVGGRFGKITEASDVYGLGATLYYILTARHPFLGRSVKEVREKIKNQRPDPLTQTNPDVSIPVEALCLRCLKKRQSDRFDSPEDLIHAIDNVLATINKDDPRGEKAKVRVMRRIAAATRKLVEAGNRSERPNTSTGKITRETGRYRTSGIGRLDRTGKMRRGESDRSPQGRLSAKATGRHNRLTNSPKTGRAAREGNGSDRQKTRPPTKRKRNLAASGALQAAEPTDKSQQIAIAIVAGLLGLLFVVIAALFLMSK